jgi:hypothetical protein
LVWRALLGVGKPGEKMCFCGRPFPAVEKYEFRFNTGRESHYLLGQCGQCRTVFWEEAEATPPRVW